MKSTDSPQTNQVKSVVQSHLNAPVLKQSYMQGAFDPAKHQKFLTAINEPNPLALKTLEEQGASIQAKVIRLNNDPMYQKLSMRGRLYVRSKLYDQYVVPAYTNAGAKPPDFKAWLLGTTGDQVGKINPESFFESKSIQAAHDLVTAFTNTASKLVLAGAYIHHAQEATVLGLTKFFTGNGAVSDSGADVIAAKERAENKQFEHMKAAINNIGDSQNFYLENHPRSGFLASAPSWTGEQIAMLPLYEAINPVTKGIGEGAVALGEKALGSKLAANLTNTLVGSKIGQFVGNRIVQATAKFMGRRAEDAATGFMAGKSLGESNAQSGADAASFAVGGGALESAIPIAKGAAYIAKDLNRAFTPPAEATDEMIKEWTANNLAMGGRPFVEAIHNQADLEEGQDRVLRTYIPPDPNLKHTYTKTGNGNKWNVNIKGENPEIDYKSNTNTTFTSEAEADAYIAQHKANNDPAKTISAETVAKVSASRAKRETDDPTTHNLVKAERYTLNSLSKRHYGTEYGNLSRGKRQIIKDRRIELMHEAEYEMPALVPDLNRMEVQSDHEKQVAESPVFARASAFLDQMFPEQGKGGISVINQQQVEANQIITGIKNSVKKAAEVQSVRERPVTDAKDEKMDGDRFASYRVDTIAYFRNPTSRGKYANARAADGTLIGNRSKLSWNERMKRENFNEFIDTLKEADGDRIHFENPYHRMLFHWANRDSLPTPVRDKLLREIKGWLARQKQPVFASAKEISEQADWNLVHTIQMAQTGRLTKEGNIFRSTQMNGPGTMTQWQGELLSENEQQEYETLKKTLTLYPDQKELLENAMSTLQSGRATAQTPKEWLEYNAAINQHLKLGGVR